MECCEFTFLHAGILKWVLWWGTLGDTGAAAGWEFLSSRLGSTKLLFAVTRAEKFGMCQYFWLFNLGELFHFGEEEQLLLALQHQVVVARSCATLCHAKVFCGLNKLWCFRAFC